MLKPHTTPASNHQVQGPGPHGHDAALALQATYVPSGHIRQFFDIAVATLKRWAETGQIGFVRTSERGKRRLYNFHDVQRQFGIDPRAIDVLAKPKLVVGYAHVSTPKQRDDLARQIADIREAM